jgi:hypothetical protein
VAHKAKLERQHRERVVETAAAAAEAKANAPTNEEDDFKSVDDWMASGGYGNTDEKEDDDDEKSTTTVPKSDGDTNLPPKTPKSFSLPTTQEELDAFNKLLEQSNFSSLRSPDAVSYTELRKELDRRDESLDAKLARRDESLEAKLTELLKPKTSPFDLPPRPPSHVSW